MFKYECTKWESLGVNECKSVDKLVELKGWNISRRLKKTFPTLSFIESETLEMSESMLMSVNRNTEIYRYLLCLSTPVLGYLNVYLWL